MKIWQLRGTKAELGRKEDGTYIVYTRRMHWVAEAFVLLIRNEKKTKKVTEIDRSAFELGRESPRRGTPAA